MKNLVMLFKNMKNFGTHNLFICDMLEWTWHEQTIDKVYKTIQTPKMPEKQREMENNILIYISWISYCTDINYDMRTPERTWRFEFREIMRFIDFLYSEKKNPFLQIMMYFSILKFDFCINLRIIFIVTIIYSFVFLKWGYSWK